MKAETIVVKIHCARSYKEELELIKEYARIQIEKDRERVKEYLGEGVLITQINKVIDNTPIILDGELYPQKCDDCKGNINNKGECFCNR